MENKDKEDILYDSIKKEIKEKQINEITDKYSNELRLCIQFATPYSCEGLAVKILKEAIKECLMLKCSKINKQEIKQEIKLEIMDGEPLNYLNKLFSKIGGGKSKFKDRL